MIIKKFTGKTESEATETAKKELGDNIVIMNVRPVKKSGFFALFAPPKIEVTVALEDEPSKVTRSVRPAKDQGKTVRPSNKPVSMADKLLKAQAEGEIPPLKVANTPIVTPKNDVIKEAKPQQEVMLLKKNWIAFMNLLNRT